MKKTLLTTLCLSAVLAAGAVPGVATVKKVNNESGAPKFNKVINPRVMAKAAGVTLSEGFDGADFELPNSEESMTWLPDGWVMESKGDENLATINKWFRYVGTSPYLPSPSDGKYFMEILYADANTKQDEWLISPEITVTEGELLSFYSVMDPAYFYYIDAEHADSENIEWIKQEICQTFRVLVKESEGEWEVLHDFAEAFMGKSLQEITDLSTEMTEKLKEYTFPLDKYAGKSVKIGFQYVGMGGNSMYLDQVRVGLPEISATYIPDYCTQYYGTIMASLAQGAPEVIAVLPPYAPINWWNLSEYAEDVAYSWTYPSSDGDGTAVTDEWDLMEVSFAPRYGDDGNYVARDNWYNNPSLTATAPGYADKTFTAPGKFQIGGKAENELAGNMTTFGLMPLSPAEYGLDIAVGVKDDDFGTFPIFGYGEGTDEFWTNYTFHGENGNSEYAKLRSVMNFMYPSAAPLIVDGGWVNAYGMIGPDAEFTYEIYPMIIDEKGYSPAETPIAAARCKGSAALVYDSGIYSYFTIPFKFNAPVVLDNTHPAYIVKFSGFNSPDVTYFATMQTWTPAKLCLGYLEKEITFDGYTGTSLSPMACVENEYGEMMGAFALNLDACYPWLTSDVETIDLGAGTSTEIAIESFYDGADLTVEASPWINATVSGRYANAKLTVSAAETDSELRAGYLKISAPGVSKTFTVTQKKSAIDSIIADGSEATVTAVYTLAGVEVSATDNLAAGVYIVRYSDGSTRKLYVK